MEESAGRAPGIGRTAEESREAWCTKDERERTQEEEEEERGKPTARPLLEYKLFMTQTPRRQERRRREWRRPERNEGGTRRRCGFRGISCVLNVRRDRAGTGRGACLRKSKFRSHRCDLFSLLAVKVLKRGKVKADTGCAVVCKWKRFFLRGGDAVKMSRLG